MKGRVAYERILSVVLMLFVPAVAPAEDLALTRDAVRLVIEGQIDAFRRDDAAAAYSFAAPAIRRLFPNAELFMEMVRRGYQPVYRPQGVVFGSLRESEGALLQEVRLVGPDSQDYLAVYTLERQPDGSLSITGCRVVRIAGQGT
jgi:hypothetical protein